MPTTIDSREEQQLLDAAKTAADLVTAGLTPDAAVEKVARDQGFGPGKIGLLGQAYNTGQQLNQWRSPARGILDKLASFELCDPQNVIDRIYGNTTTVKEAQHEISPEYRRAPSWLVRPTLEKAAAYKLPESTLTPYTPDPAEAVEKAFSNIQRVKLAHEEQRRQLSAANDRLRSTVSQLVGYFKQASAARYAFDVVESAAREYCGEPATALLGLVYTQARLNEKRAGDRPPLLRTPLDQNTAPFTLIKLAIALAATCHQAKEATDVLSQRVKTAKDAELRPFSAAGQTQQPVETGPWLPSTAAIFGEKRAFGFGTEVAAIAAGDILAHKATHQPEEEMTPDILGLDDELAEIRRQAAMRPQQKRMKTAALGAGMAAVLGGSLGRTMGPVGKTKSDLVEDAWLGLEDPEHDNELRKIRAHAMINQLMTDPDEPISGHEPDRVLQAYNEIASATPRVAQNVATLRPALRKRLEGHQEPFEAKELLDIEHGLARTKMPTPRTSIMGETPESILG